MKCKDPTKNEKMLLVFDFKCHVVQNGFRSFESFAQWMKLKKIKKIGHQL